MIPWVFILYAYINVVANPLVQSSMTIITLLLEMTGCWIYAI